MKTLGGVLAIGLAFAAYIVYNDTRDTIGAQLRERTLIVKLTNLFNF